MATDELSGETYMSNTDPRDICILYHELSKSLSFGSPATGRRGVCIVIVSCVLVDHGSSIVACDPLRGHPYNLVLREPKIVTDSGMARLSRARPRNATGDCGRPVPFKVEQGRIFPKSTPKFTLDSQTEVARPPTHLARPLHS